jgi:hypothetical protein
MVLKTMKVLSDGTRVRSLPNWVAVAFLLLVLLVLVFTVCYCFGYVATFVLTLLHNLKKH